MYDLPFFFKHYILFMVQMSAKIIQQTPFNPFGSEC